MKGLQVKLRFNCYGVTAETNIMNSMREAVEVACALCDENNPPEVWVCLAGSTWAKVDLSEFVG